MFNDDLMVCRLSLWFSEALDVPIVPYIGDQTAEENYFSTPVFGDFKCLPGFNVGDKQLFQHGEFKTCANNLKRAAGLYETLCARCVRSTDCAYVNTPVTAVGAVVLRSEINEIVVMRYVNIFIIIAYRWIGVRSFLFYGFNCRTDSGRWTRRRISITTVRVHADSIEMLVSRLRAAVASSSPCLSVVRKRFQRSASGMSNDVSYVLTDLAPAPVGAYRWVCAGVEACGIAYDF